MIKRLWPRSLMGRALLIVVTPLILTQVFSSYVFYERHWDQISKQLSLGLAGDIATLVQTLKEFPNQTDWAIVADAARRRMDIDATFEPGAILPNKSEEGETSIEGELRRALINKDINNPVRVDSRSSPESVIVYVQLPDGVLRAITPRTRLFSWTTYVFVLFTVGTSLILLGVAIWFMRNQIRPVRRLARVADAFGKGREVTGFRLEGAREIRQVGIAFMSMRNRIQRQITQRTTMLAGVSHDMRTPLTRMRLELELMEENESVIALKEDIGDMERMLNEYLAFARGEGTEKTEPRDLKVLLDEAIRQVRRKGRDVEFNTEGDLYLPVRPNAISRCLLNLLENAIRYARHVFINAARRGANIEVVIDDDGPGIPRDKREDVFRPFFRLDQSRNTATGGVGLGLTIARDVARGHGGDVLLEDSPQGGLRVRLRLPI